MDETVGNCDAALDKNKAIDDVAVHGSVVEASKDCPADGIGNAVAMRQQSSSSLK